jgi:hypothetical protein
LTNSQIHTIITSELKYGNGGSGIETPSSIKVYTIDRRLCDTFCTTNPIPGEPGSPIPPERVTPGAVSDVLSETSDESTIESE